jgi:hypothetical protein
MSSSQEPTSPTTGGTPRLDWSSIYPRPMQWFCEIGLSLLMAGSLIAAASPAASAWATVGLLLMMLSLFVLSAVIGALLALRHPWGACFRVLVERHYAHPRLVGLAVVWAGLVTSSLMGAILYLARPPFPSALDAADGWKWLLAGGVAALALFLIALAPLLALALFDRRR